MELQTQAHQSSSFLTCFRRLSRPSPQAPHPPFSVVSPVPILHLICLAVAFLQISPEPITLIHHHARLAPTTLTDSPVPSILRRELETFTATAQQRETVDQTDHAITTERRHCARPLSPSTSAQLQRCRPALSVLRSPPPPCPAGGSQLLNPSRLFDKISLLVTATTSCADARCWMCLILLSLISAASRPPLPAKLLLFFTYYLLHHPPPAIL